MMPLGFAVFTTIDFSCADVTPEKRCFAIATAPATIADEKLVPCTTV